MRASPEDILGMTFFARVVEAKSFSDAARSLGVSKSAVSARVARLEERLGVRLLHRTTRRLALTADGVRIYEHCARVLTAADQAAEVAAGASAAPRGTLRLQAPLAFARAYLAPLLEDFLRAHEGVRVALSLSDRLPDFEAGGIDVAIVVASRLADSGLVARKLATTRVVACASPDYLRRKGIPFRPQDLVLHRCVAHSQFEGSEGWSFQTDEGPVSMAKLATLVVDDTGFVHEAALGGLGIALLPGPLVSEDLVAGRLHRVLEDIPTVELGVHAVHPHGRLPSATVRAFVDHLAAHFRHPPWPQETPAKATRPAGPGRRGGVPMTGQDVRRLDAVARLYEDIQAEACEWLRQTLSRVRVRRAATFPRSTVTMNSRVRCHDAAGTERQIALVYPWDEGPGRTSVLSPLGHALLGAAVGDRVKAGTTALTITSIPYQPEAAGDHSL